MRKSEAADDAVTMARGLEIDLRRWRELFWEGGGTGLGFWGERLLHLMEPAREEESLLLEGQDEDRFAVVGRSCPEEVMEDIGLFGIRDW